MKQEKKANYYPGDIVELLQEINFFGQYTIAKAGDRFKVERDIPEGGFVVADFSGIGVSYNAGTEYLYYGSIVLYKRSLRNRIKHFFSKQHLNNQQNEDSTRVY